MGVVGNYAYGDVPALMSFLLLMLLINTFDQIMKDNLHQVFISYKIFTSSG